MKSSTLGILALLVAIVALALAVLPALAMESPRHLTSIDELAEPGEIRPRQSPEDEVSGSITLKFDKFSVTLGEHPEEPSPAEQKLEQELAYRNAAIDRQLARRETTIGRFTFAAICCALVGLLISPIAWVREKQPFLSGSAMSICGLALFWQYIVIGIATAVTIVLVIVLLSALASS